MYFKFVFGLSIIFQLKDVSIRGSPIKVRREFDPNTLMYDYMKLRTNIDSFGSFHPDDVVQTVEKTFQPDSNQHKEQNTESDTGVQSESNPDFDPSKWGFSIYNPNNGMDQYMGHIIQSGLSGPQFSGKEASNSEKDTEETYYSPQQNVPLGMDFDPNNLNKYLMSLSSGYLPGAESGGLSTSGTVQNFDPSKLNKDIFKYMAYSPANVNAMVIPQAIFPETDVKQHSSGKMNMFTDVHLTSRNNSIEKGEANRGQTFGIMPGLVPEFNSGITQGMNSPSFGPGQKDKATPPPISTTSKNNKETPDVEKELPHHQNNHESMLNSVTGVNDGNGHFNSNQFLQQLGSSNTGIVHATGIGSLGPSSGVYNGYVKYQSQIGPAVPEREQPLGTGNAGTDGNQTLIDGGIAQATGIGSLGNDGSSFGSSGSMSILTEGNREPGNVLNKITNVQATGIGSLGEQTLTQHTITPGMQTSQQNVNQEITTGFYGTNGFSLHQSGTQAMGTVNPGHNNINPVVGTKYTDTSVNVTQTTDWTGGNVIISEIGNTGAHGPSRNVSADGSTGNSAISQVGGTGGLGSSALVNGVGSLGNSAVSQVGVTGGLGSSAYVSGIGSLGNTAVSQVGGTGGLGSSAYVSGIGSLGNTAVSQVGVTGGLGSSAHVSGIGSLGNTAVSQVGVTGGLGSSAHVSGIGSLGNTEVSQVGVTGGLGSSAHVSGIGSLGNSAVSQVGGTGGLGSSAHVSGIGSLGNTAVSQVGGTGGHGSSAHVSGIGSLGNAAVSQVGVTGGLGSSAPASGIGSLENTAVSQVGGRGGLGSSAHVIGIGSLGNAAVSQEGGTGGIGSSAYVSGIGSLGNTAVSQVGGTGGLGSSAHVSGIGSLGNTAVSQVGGTGGLASSAHVSGIGSLGNAAVSQVGVTGGLVSSAPGSGIGSLENTAVSQVGGTGGLGSSAHVSGIGSLGNTAVSQVGGTGGLGSSAHVSGIGSLGNTAVSQEGGTGGIGSSAHVSGIGSLGNMFEKQAGNKSHFGSFVKGAGPLGNVVVSQTGSVGFSGQVNGITSFEHNHLAQKGDFSVGNEVKANTEGSHSDSSNNADAELSGVPSTEIYSSDYGGSFDNAGVPIAGEFEGPRPIAKVTGIGSLGNTNITQTGVMAVYSGSSPLAKGSESSRINLSQDNGSGNTGTAFHVSDTGSSGRHDEISIGLPGLNNHFNEFGSSEETNNFYHESQKGSNGIFSGKIPASPFSFSLDGTSFNSQTGSADGADMATFLNEQGDHIEQGEPNTQHATGQKSTGYHRVTKYIKTQQK